MPTHDQPTIPYPRNIRRAPHTNAHLHDSGTKRPMENERTTHTPQYWPRTRLERNTVGNKRRTCPYLRETELNSRPFRSHTRKESHQKSNTVSTPRYLNNPTLRSSGKTRLLPEYKDRKQGHSNAETYDNTGRKTCTMERMHNMDPR